MGRGGRWTASLGQAPRAALRATAFTWATVRRHLPGSGTGAALVMRCQYRRMNQHLAEIKQMRQVVHCPANLDGAGWHSSPQLILPKNIVLMPLPSTRLS